MAPVTSIAYIRSVLISRAASASARVSASARASAPAGDDINDPLVTHLNQTNDLYHEKVLKPLTSIWKQVRAARDLMAAREQAATSHDHHHRSDESSLNNDANLADKKKEISQSLWDVRDDAFRLQRRLKTQAERVSRKVKTKKYKCTAPKSKAHQKAGKRNAHSLKEWQGDFKGARDALKADGYKGTLKIKNGLPVYGKMQEMRQGRT